ncbi:hypothetical protein [Fusarium oxysporum alternavirus 1]|uniref:hypothetical protein n=1 Tax=Fusarium oxysporum alternavirus 1 TaxID=2867550 RepID=UPI0022076439|nr:hypothetical protein QK877_s4gp1 [Fusarium oxysporum alternavirus 1]QYY49565.2 hypothetical protein [Fusarium oxysporum alternavirus 1]
MDTFAAEDRYALQGTRLAVERARLPADVLADFREWVLVSLFCRGRDKISDYFFDVCRFEGVEDIENESDVFGSYLAHEFDRFLSTDGARFASRFRSRPAPRAPEPVQPRQPSPVGPALPPWMLKELREQGLVVASVEDIESGIWRDSGLVATHDDSVTVVSSQGDSTPQVFTPATLRSVDVYPLEFDEGRYSLPPSRFDEGRYAVPPDKLPAPLVLDGVDWSNPRVQFCRGAAVAFVEAEVIQPGAGPPFRDKFKRGVSVHTGCVHGSTSSRARVPPVSIEGADSDVPGGGHYGMRAIVADDHYRESLHELGVAPSMNTLLNWVKLAGSRGYAGGLELFAEFDPTASGPYPRRFYCRRRRDAPVRVKDLLGTWRGKSATLDAGPLPEW